METTTNSLRAVFCDADRSFCSREPPFVPIWRYVILSFLQTCQNSNYDKLTWEFKEFLYFKSRMERCAIVFIALPQVIRVFM